MIIRLLISCFLFLCISSVKAQTDTAFWFVAPESTSGHADRPIFLRFTALAQFAQVTIIQPANDNFNPIVLDIPANSTQSIDITSMIEFIETKPANQVLNTGLLIRSTAFITSYYEQASNNNPEIFALKGRNALGTNFFIPSQNVMNNVTSANPRPYNSFDIVATENNTVVTIIPSADIEGHAAGVPFTVTLNRGQTYSAAASSNLAANHLMGSIVTSNKPIAITIKDDSITRGGSATCSDFAGDQIVPTTLIGTKYISLPGYLNNPSSDPSDVVFILATQDNTTVTVNGAQVATLNAGETHRQNSFNSVFYFETSKPVYALHLSGFGCEVGQALLPQLDCSGSRTVGFTRSVNSPLFVNILVPNGGENSFTFNGNTTTINAGQFANVPNTNGQWKYARIELSTSQMQPGSTAIVKNSSKDFHLSVIHGDVLTGCRYGYFSDYNRFEANSLSNATPNNPGCVGDTLKLYCDVGAAEGILFSWTGPNGFTSNLQNPTIPNMQPNMAGNYTVVATKPGCSTLTKSTTVFINQKPSVSALLVNPVCEKNSITLSATSAGVGATYSWVGPNNYSSNNLNNTLSNLTAAASGNYILTTTLNGCNDKDTVAVTIKPLPSVQINVPATICNNTVANFSNNNTITPATYSWTGPNNFQNSNQNFSIPTFNSTHVGKYVLSITANGCTAKDSITVSLKNSPIVQFNAINSICDSANAIQLNATETTGIAGTFVFTGPGVSSTGLFNPANAGGTGSKNIIYTFNATNGCSAAVQSNINVLATPIVNAGNNKVIIQNASIVLDANVIGNAATVNWIPNYNLSSNTTLNPTANPLVTTTYRLNVTSNNGCSAFDTVEIKVIPRLDIPNAFSPNGDGVNDTWQIPSLVAFPNCEIEIFDRSGRSIFFSKSYNTPWNGMLNNKPLPVGVYYYILRLNDTNYPNPVSGSITILR